MRLRTIILLLLSTLVMGWGNAVFLYADNCEQLRQSLKQKKGKELVLAYEKLYYCSLDSDDFEYQLRCVNDYIAEARHQGLKDVEVDALAERAVLFYNNAEDDSIITVVRKDLEIVKKSGQWRIFYEMWTHVVNAYLFTNQNKKGLEETKAMFKDAMDRNNDFGMGLAYCGMGTAYANMRNFDESVDAYQHSLDILSAMTPSPSILPDVYAYYGNTLNDMKEFGKLEELTRRWQHFLEAYIKDHHLENNPTGNVYLSYYYFACVQADLGLGKLDDAEEKLMEVQEYVTEDSFTGMKFLYYMAQLRLMQGKYMEALSYNNQRMQHLEEGGDETVRIMVMQQRAEIMEQQVRFSEAARLYRQIYLLNDSANAQETKVQLNEMNAIFQVNEKKAENQRLQMEKERDQFRFIIIVAVVVLLSLGIFLFFRIRSARKLKQAHTKLQAAYSDLQAANEVIEETTAAKERIESELRIARDIQMSMVPTVFPDYPGLDIFASMTPAKEVGGDLYCSLLLDDQLYFCVGDVSGKGVPASLFMAQAARLFRTLAKQRLMPGEIGTRLNEELAEDNEQGMFVTMFLGLIDLKTGHLSFCNAGHNPPVLNGAFMEMEPNAPVGLWPGLEYVCEEVADISGQQLFIYTDSLNEAENRQQDQFGDDHLLEVLGGMSVERAQQTVEQMKAEVEKHRDGADPNDDLTMMCIKLEKNNN